MAGVAGRGPTRPPARRLLLVAVIGAVAALAFAFSPAEQATQRYEFRPAGIMGDPVVAPLAIARSVPDTLELVMPCDVPGSQFRSMTLGNWSGIEGATRSAIEYQDLGISLQVGVGDGYAFMALGGTEVARLTVRHVDGCEVAVSYDGTIWDFAADGERVGFDGGAPRFAEALFDGPAIADPITVVLVETRELGTSPSRTQVVLLVVALVAMGWTTAQMGARTVPVESPAGEPVVGWRIRLVDMVVGLGLFAWILLIPAGFDDGWVVARQGAYSAHGAFSNLFDLDAAVLPLAHWVEWLQRFWLGISANAVWARIPVLAMAGTIWVGLRWLLRRLDPGAEHLSEWVMAAAFLVGFGAWNITLRPEPVLAGLLVASVGCAVAFQRGGRGRILAIWMAVIALAVTAHPAGVIAVAPLLASAGSLVRWVRADRQGRWLAATAAVLLVGMTVVVLFVDGDVATRLASIESLQAGGHDKSILDESLRYEFLGEAPYGTGMRRTSVGLILVGAGLFILGLDRRGSDSLSRLPARSLLIAVGLLALTPSKWSWHFGGLVGLAALAVALELARLRRGLDPEHGVRRVGAIRSGLAVLGIAGVAAWSWRVATSWTALDLRSLDWWAGASNFSPLDLASPLVWLGVVVVAGIVLRLVAARIGVGVGAAPEVVLLVAAALAIGVTGATLAFDTMRTGGWTFGRQNIQSLWGGAACGLGEEIVIPLPGSLHALSPTVDSGGGADQVAADRGFASNDDAFRSGGFPAIEPNGIRPDGFNAVLPIAGVEHLGSWGTIDSTTPEAGSGGLISPWHRLEDESSVALMLLGSIWDWDPEGNAVALQWGVAESGGVRDLGVEHVAVSGYFVDWAFVSLTRHPGADRVRVLARDARVEGEQAWVASSMPLGLSTGTLAEVSDTTDILVSPPLGLYFPCISAPDFEGAVVPPPGVIVNMWRVMWETTYAAAAASDRYFRIDVNLGPPLRTSQVGAHLGDPSSLVFVSQEYLTGTPARANAAFTRLP